MDKYYPITIAEGPEDAIQIKFEVAVSDIPFGISVDYVATNNEVVCNITYSSKNEKTEVARINDDLIAFYGVNSGRVYSFKLNNASNYKDIKKLQHLVSNANKFAQSFSSNSPRQKRNIQTARNILSETLKKTKLDFSLA